MFNEHEIETTILAVYERLKFRYEVNNAIWAYILEIFETVQQNQYCKNKMW